MRESNPKNVKIFLAFMLYVHSTELRSKKDVMMVEIMDRVVIVVIWPCSVIVSPHVVCAFHSQGIPLTLWPYIHPFLDSCVGIARTCSHTSSSLTEIEPRIGRCSH